jgi:hypothetical protein
MSRKYLYRIVLLLLLLLLLPGCSKKKSSRLTTIQVTPASTIVLLGGKQQFTAKGLDQKGKEMSGVKFSWSVVPSDAGEISQTGLFTAGEVAKNCEVLCQSGGLVKKVPVSIFTGEYFLETAGEQLVADSQTAWCNFLQSPRLMTIFNDQLLPSAKVLNSVLDGMFSNVLWFPLFYFEPGKCIIEDLRERNYDKNYDGQDPQIGIWTYTEEIYDEVCDDEGNLIDKVLLGTWTVQINRQEIEKEIGKEDQLTFELTYEEATGETSNYQGTITYPTSYLKLFVFDEPGTFTGQFVCNVTFNSDQITDGLLNGVFDPIMSTVTIKDEDVGFFEKIAGNAECSYHYNGQPYSFNGELSLLFDESKEDFFHGTFTTPETVINGDLKVTYVENPNLGEHPFKDGISVTGMPNNLILQGSLNDTKSDLSLEGKFLLELRNAATFNYIEQYSAQNCPGAYLNFTGTLCNEKNDKIAGMLSFEETAFKRFKINIGYDLTLDGVMRQIGLTGTSTSDSAMTVVLTSDWGPAEINMNLNFSPQLLYYDTEGDLLAGKISGLSGKVLVLGIEVGKISLDSDTKLPRVDYNDGTFETL